MGERGNNEIGQFVEKIKKKIDVQKVILFGSRARGDYLEDSDADMIIISRDFEGVLFYERMDKLILLRDSPLDLETLCYTPEEFEIKKKKITMKRAAVEEGIEI